MQFILNKYEVGDELEVRYYIDPRCPRPSQCQTPKHLNGFKPVYDALMAGLPKVSSTHKFIDLQVGQIRKRIEFGSAGRTETWTEKVKRGDAYVESNDFGGVKVACARETVIEPRVIEHVDRLCAKYRRSYILEKPEETEKEKKGDWRLDISLVKLCTLDNIQDAKTRLLATEIPPWSWWDHCEFEIEYIGGEWDPQLDTVIVYDWYRILIRNCNFDHLNAIRRLAFLIGHPKATQFSKISPRNTLSRLLPKAIEPTLEQWVDEYAFAVEGMILRDKINGVREVVWIQNGKFTIVGAKDIDVFDEPTADDTYIFDAEYKDDVWYILHPLVWRGECVTNMIDSDRLALITRDGLPAGIEGLAVCPWIKLDAPATQIPAFWKRTVAYERDGLIPATDEPYFTQRTTKWKPEDESTHDLLIIKCPEWLEGKTPFVAQREGTQLYLLNVGVQSSLIIKQHGFPLKRYLDMFQMGGKDTTYLIHPFSPPDAPNTYIWESAIPKLHGRIGELLYSVKTKQWTLKRIRDDKPSVLMGGSEFGNDMKTALDIWTKHKTPFPVEYLWQPPSQRSNPLEFAQDAALRVVAELAEEEAIETAISHMCPFIPFGADIKYHGILEPTGRGYENYQPGVVRSRVEHMSYDQIGRITLAKDFIGGAQLLISFDPELLGHVSCLAKVVAAGGRMVVIARFAAGDDPHPLVGRAALMKDMERAGFELLADHGSIIDLATDGQAWDAETTEERFAKFSILSFRKENRGNSEMTPTEVRAENPHLTDNPEANFGYKFTRQKTKDLNGFGVEARRSCTSMRIDPILGRLLCDIEYLCGFNATAQVLYLDTAEPTKLRALFPQMQFIARENATRENVEVMISHLGYEETLAALDKHEPHSAMMIIDAATLVRTDKKILKGKMSFIPYMSQDSTDIVLQIGRRRDYWNIMPEMFEKEMQTFHKVYRTSAFKYARKPHKSLDNCYDCRTMAYIVDKYARFAKITSETAFASLT